MNHFLDAIGLVIPAYNEANNLGHILDIVCKIFWLTQIIVVDDGSTDKTLSIAEQYVTSDPRVWAVHLPVNLGKANAMLAGTRALTTDLVLYLDADLVGIKAAHLQALCQPVISGTYQMSLAVFRHGGLLTDASHFIAPSLSGQRCLWRGAAETALVTLKDTRYGVETGLTIHAKRQNWHVQKVIWQAVTHHMKEQKRSIWIGIQGRLQMYQQIASVLGTSNHKLAFQRVRAENFSREKIRR